MSNKPETKETATGGSVANADLLGVVFNGSRKIDDANRKDYIVLTDYGSEGLAVSYQSESLRDAIDWISTTDYSGSHSLVKLVRLKINESA